VKGERESRIQCLSGAAPCQKEVTYWWGMIEGVSKEIENGPREVVLCMADSKKESDRAWQRRERKSQGKEPARSSKFSPEGADSVWPKSLKEARIKEGQEERVNKRLVYTLASATLGRPDRGGDVLEPVSKVPKGDLGTWKVGVKERELHKKTGRRMNYQSRRRLFENSPKIIEKNS